MEQTTTRWVGGGTVCLVCTTCLPLDRFLRRWLKCRNDKLQKCSWPAFTSQSVPKADPSRPNSYSQQPRLCSGLKLASLSSQLLPLSSSMVPKGTSVGTGISLSSPPSSFSHTTRSSLFILLDPFSSDGWTGCGSSGTSSTPFIHTDMRVCLHTNNDSHWDRQAQTGCSRLFPPAHLLGCGCFFSPPLCVPCFLLPFFAFTQLLLINFSFLSLHVCLFFTLPQLWLSLHCCAWIHWFIQNGKCQKQFVVPCYTI